jgi:pimeloyl-ACP methyl ester carboxylesterase/DNA-binding CsgD family transcriptional regulator
MDQDIRFCAAADGARIAYAVSGKGPPLVMAATWLTHLEHQWRSLAWRPWLDAFGRDYTLLRHDSRGCGLSDRNAPNLSFESWVADFACVVEAASFDRFAIVGTCWGGPVAMEYAARYPDRVSHLVLYGTYARGRLRRTDSPQEIERSRVLLQLMRLGWGQEAHDLARTWAAAFQPGGGLEYQCSWADQMRHATSAETAAHLLQIGWDTDVQETARKIRCPVLIVHAEHDSVAPIDEGRRLASLIPNCRFVQIDSQNHMPLADEPEWPRLVDHIRKFLAEPGHDSGRAALPLDQLTVRERAVLEGIAGGLDNAEIAASIGLSEKTVRNHITRVFDKLGVEHRYQAIVRARDAGLGKSNTFTAGR